MQVELGKTLDVGVVERQLADLWQQTAGESTADDDVAVLRARVANLLVFVASDTALADVHQMLEELTAIHPSRVLVMFGSKGAEDRDIEMSVETICQTDKRSGAKRLSCEEVTLIARGKFVVELPSAALPLLVPDLSTFLWWRSVPEAGNKVLDTLLRATDRLVIDSAEFADPLRDLIETNKLYDQDQFDHLGISDLNWARLTFWRGLLADFYDVPAYQALLAGIDSIEIDYVTPEHGETSVAPQALLIAGWLASRLGWTLADEQPSLGDEITTFRFLMRERGTVSLNLKRVEQREHKAGRLIQVVLHCSTEQVSFAVARSADNLHVLAEARVGASIQRGRMLPVRNRSAALLLGREMEILCNDQIYQEAIAVAAKMITLLSDSPESE